MVQPNLAAMGKLGDNGMIGIPNKVSAHALEVPEAFEAVSGQNEDTSLDINSTFGQACHKYYEGGGYEQYKSGRAEMFQVEFGRAFHEERLKYGKVDIVHQKTR